MPQTDGRRVLVTGVSGQLAGQLASRLEDDERVDHVIGVDLREPGPELARTGFVRADLREAGMADVLEEAGIDTVVHTDLVTSPAQAGGRTPMRERNVIATMQLLAAVQRARRVRRLVVRSSTAVYGGAPTAPALLAEDAEPPTRPRGPASEDIAEVERCVAAFVRRRDDVAVSVLRFAELVGPTVESPLTRLFALPVVPTLLGHDPRLQLCHEADAADVACAMALDDRPGTYNVAGPGVVYLSQALRLAGKPGVPVPPGMAASTAGLTHGAAAVGGLARRRVPAGLARRGAAGVARRGTAAAGLARRGTAADLARRGVEAAGRVREAAEADFTLDQVELLSHSRVANIDRLRDHAGLHPRFPTREAFEDFLASGRVTPTVDAERLAAWQARLARLAGWEAVERPSGSDSPPDDSGPPPPGATPGHSGTRSTPSGPRPTSTEEH